MPLKMIKENKSIKTGADIANEITSYEAMHESSLDTKEYKDLVGTGWVSLEWLKEQVKNHSLGASQVQGIFNRQIEEFLQGKPLTDKHTDWISINELLALLEG